MNTLFKSTTALAALLCVSLANGGNIPGAFNYELNPSPELQALLGSAKCVATTPSMDFNASINQMVYNNVFIRCIGPTGVLGDKKPAAVYVGHVGAPLTEMPMYTFVQSVAQGQGIGKGISLNFYIPAQPITTAETVVSQ